MEEDKRFSHIATDPKFKRIPKRERKIKIDKRFKSMFKDKQFKVKYTVDKRGRPVNHTSNEDLKRYYELSSAESSESENDEEIAGRFVRPPKSSESEVEKQSGQDDESESEPEQEAESNQLKIKHKSDKKVPDKIKQKLSNLNIDYARGESALFSESSSDDEQSDSDTSEEEKVEHAWGELDRDAEKTEAVTYRLAACNMDWDRIRAMDLMVLLNSFLPPGGLIKSVTIYPSEFGLQRMKEEEIKGPSELVESAPVDEEEEGTEGSKYHMEKLRQYQLNRLKYYYAVIVCDCEATANKIYTECDGLEYESSATKMDLRFIPDDMVFEQEPKETCDKLPEPGKYQPRFFTTTALQQAKVDLTWDETDPNRIEVTQKLASGKVDDIDDADLQAYLASSSDEENGEAEESTNDEESDDDSKLNSIDKYKALLQDIENHEKEKNKKDVEMEISWGINLKEKTEKLVKKKLDEKEQKTPFQQYLEKRKEKKKAKREERKKKNQDSEGDSDIPSDIDMNDPYFAEEFDKPEFRKKKNKNVKEKQSDSEDDSKKAELELLLANDDEDNSKRHFSLKKIQERENEGKNKKKLKDKKRKQEDIEQDEDEFRINVADERFSALYSSHHFNVDPTDPRYKKTKAMEAIVNEKLKRKSEFDSIVEVKKVKSNTCNKDPELSVLIKSVKRKTEMLGNKKTK